MEGYCFGRLATDHILGGRVVFVIPYACVLVFLVSFSSFLVAAYRENARGKQPNQNGTVTKTDIVCGTRDEANALLGEPHSIQTFTGGKSLVCWTSGHLAGTVSILFDENDNFIGCSSGGE